MSSQYFTDYKIFTDATADLNQAMLSGLPSVGIIPMEVEVGGDPYLYGPQGNLTVSRFYAMQREGRFASTSQINPYVYTSAFEKALQSGMDVLYLCFSSGMSGTISTAKSCMEELRTKYPERRLICVDTLCAAPGEGLLVREAAKKQMDGMGIDELAQWVLEHRLDVCHWFTVDTFEHLKHGGRVSAAAASVGTILNIKPLLHVDEAGKLGVVQKPRGNKRAMRLQLEKMEAGWTPEISRDVIIGHGDNPAYAAALSDLVQERFPDARIITTEIGPIIGAHTGPDMLCLIYWGTNR